jgi:AcrR family transcriptional regulator
MDMPAPRARQARIAAPPRLARQARKSAKTRGRICAAAAATIARQGYHRTTIPEVVRRAGASVGAVQHHFPTKVALVAATADYLLTRSVRWFARARSELATTASAPAAALAALIDRSWREQFTTPEYAALLEILVAARTDPTLKKAVAPRLKSWRAEIESELGAFMPDDAARLETLLTIGRCMMTGLLVHDGLIGDRARMETVISDWAAIASARTG